MPVAPSPDSRQELVKDRLRQAAEHRRNLTMSHETLSDEIRRLVRDAEDLGIPTAEVARLLEIDRSTLYRVYRAAA